MAELFILLPIIPLLIEAKLEVFHLLKEIWVKNMMIMVQTFSLNHLFLIRIFIIKKE